MNNMIEINHLSKRFGDVRAVQDLSFRVKEGELFAFLGINGAGKSTTINIMCGQLAKDSGTVQIGGMDLEKNPDQIKSALGVVFQNSVLDQELSVQDNLQSRAALYGITGKAFWTRLSELAGLLEFEDLQKRTVGKLSGGQRRRIDIARALLNRPKLLILDEPTTGLDPQTRNILWRVIGELRKKENMTVFLTTHYMEEAADADYVVILDSGRIAANGTPLELKNAYTGDSLALDVTLLVLFGTALSSCVNFFLSTQGQASAVGTIVSAGYGFICGAYMPISQFSDGLQKAISFLPDTYGTSLLRNHMLGGVFEEMGKQGIPNEVVEVIRDSVDCNLYFFGEKVSLNSMYVILAASVAAAVAVYVGMNVLSGKKKR